MVCVPLAAFAPVLAAECKAARFDLQPEIIKFDPAIVDRMDLNVGILARWARRSWPTSMTAYTENAHKMDRAHQFKVRKVHP